MSVEASQLKEKLTIQQKLIDGLKQYLEVNLIKGPIAQIKAQHAFLLGAHAAGAELSPAIMICLTSGRLITELK